MKKRRSLLSSLIIIVLVITAIVFLANHFRIADFQIVKPGVLYTSGQPRGMDYTRLLYKYHIATIVNVRFPFEHRDHNWYHEEMAWVKKNQVRYVELPMQKASYFPDGENQTRFLSVMSTRDNLPVLLHGSGDDKRVAMLTAVWLRKNQKYTVEQTIKIIKEIIDGKELTEEELRFIADLYPTFVPTRQDAAGP